MSKTPLNDKNFQQTTNPGIKGRGSSTNETSRFHQLKVEEDLSDAGWLGPEDQPSVRTVFFEDSSRSILSENNSPDIPFRYGLNPYRGCEHGCIYCYARPTHEYLGFSAGIDFESKIMVKLKAPEILHETFMKKSWQPECIMMSGVTDCYQPAERKFKLTRQCLEVFARFRNPVSIITKNALITRDVDILSELAAEGLVTVNLSVTTLDAGLGRVLEPRTSTPRARLEAVSLLAKAGIPVGVNVAPVIPGLTEQELPSILKAAADAGAQSAGYALVRLPYSVKELFADWLDRHRPEKKQKVLNSIRDVRGGGLNVSEFGSRMRGEGDHAQMVKTMFKIFSEKYGLNKPGAPLRTDKFRRPEDQLSLL